ncbi:MAG: hypothetical protein RIR70_435 [Pseudomonadota bacterium]|jgi:phasin family protein
MAAPKQEAVTELQKQNLDAVMHLAQITLENAQRMAETQVETARMIFEDSVNGLRAMADAKDARSAMELRNQLTQTCGEHLLNATRKIAQLTNQTHTEIASTMSQQISSSSANMVELMTRMVQSLPLTGTESMNIFQASLDSTRSAMEQMSRAGQDALTSLTNITTRAAGAATKTATAIVEPFTPRVAAVEAMEAPPAAAAGGKRAGKHE